MSRHRGVTLIEVLVASGLLSMVLLAVLSFYVEAIAVSAKKDEHSQRLRRFSLGMEKIEQVLRGSRLVRLDYRVLTLHIPNPEQPYLKGFPNYSVYPAQLVSTADGVVLLHNGDKTKLLPTFEGEHVIFRYLNEIPESQPPAPPQHHLVSVALYAHSKANSDSFIHRTLNVARF